MNKFFIMTAIALMVPVVGHASEKYVCSLSANNQIGVGTEIDVEVLSQDSANLLSFQTGQDGQKVASPVRIDNPGSLSRTGDILHLEAVVHSTAPKDSNPSPAISGVSAIDINLSTMQLSFPKENRPDLTMPCVLSK